MAAFVDGGVVLGPVDGQAEAAEQGLEGLLVFGGEDVAELDEVAAADVDVAALLNGFGVAGIVGGGEVGVVRQRGFAADSEVVLDAAFGGQAVVVPSHRVEDLAASHALVAGDGVGVRVGEDVSDVE